ncbi:MAG TPA: GGDEF domain-containing protein [Solirubrobacteraceae bacterium]|nr:GGDEF domain-containing protein [Solirubrobacteraceae bacterium]
MVSSFEDIRTNRRIMAYTAAAIYGIAGLDGAIEGFLPGDPPFSLLPVVVVFIMFFALMAVGPRLPRRALALLGPLGVVLIAYALSTSPGPGDGAVLYALPVFWTTFFFGRRGAAVILACVAVGHAITLLALPAADSYPGRWLDVMVSVTGVALVVLVLERRNELLMSRLAGEARTDPLTGLLNRRGFDEHAARELAHLGRDGHSIALVIFDIDHFKHINDQWGHIVGDRVLAHMARLLTTEARAIDVAARLGGEEFAVLMPGGHQAGATAFAERVRRALAATDCSDVPEVRVSAGITVTIDPLEVQTVLERADQALYAAKRGGRDRSVVFDDPGLSLVA